MSVTVLIAGAGDLGTRLGLLLATQGHRVFALRRSPGTLPTGIEPFVADLTQPESLTQLPTGISHVAYTAAADGSSVEAYHAAYVAGPRNLLAALAAQGQAPQRVVFVSSTAVYAQTDGKWVDENSPTEPPHFAGQLTLQGEQELGASPWPSVIVRAGGIYGPGRTRLIDEVRSGRASYDASHPTYTNRIHVDDLARILAFALFQPTPPPRLVAVDNHPAARSEVLSWLAQQLQAPAPKPSVVTAEAAPRARRSDSNKRISNAALRALGYQFLYPSYREGYSALLSQPGQRY